MARQTLEEVTLLTVTAFSQVVVPNQLLQELRSLAETAQLDLPLVKEVAADIFMGAFSDKLLQSANRAADLLTDTLYSTYYAIDYSQIRAFTTSEQQRRRWFWQSEEINSDHDQNKLFFQLCESCSGITYKGFSPAISGMIIEQQQFFSPLKTWPSSTVSQLWLKP